MNDLQSEIEYLRKKMCITALKKGISHPDVLRISQRLDKVINEFYTVALVVQGNKKYPAQ